MPQGVTLERPATWDEVISALAEQHGVHPGLALAVAQRESQLNPDAIGKLGEIGLFQLRPDAALQVGATPEDRSDPIKNITIGVKYLKHLNEQYGGDVQKTLMAYNGGPENVKNNTVSPQAQAYAADVIASLSQGLRPKSEAKTTQDSLRERIKPAVSHQPEGFLTKAARSIGSIVPAEQTGAIAGALVGGVRGARMGAPGGVPGVVLGGVAGAGLGAFGGEGLQMALEKLSEWFGLTEPSRPVTIRDAASKMGGAANTAMMGESLGRAGIAVLTPIARRVMAPLAHKMSTYAREALATFPPASRSLLPSEISESRVLQVAENIAEGSLGGGGRVEAVKATRQGLAESKVVDILDRVGPTVTGKQAGVTAKSARTAAVKQFKADADVLFDQFRAEAGTVPIETPKLDAFIAEMNPQQAGAILPNAGAEAARRVAALSGDDASGMKQLISNEMYQNLATPSQQALVRKSIGVGEDIGGLTAAQFQKTVSDLGKLTRSLEKSAQQDPSKFNAQLGVAKKILNLAREDLINTLKARAPKAAEAYEQAAGFYRLGNERLFNQAVMNAVKVAPEQVVGKLLKANNSTAITLVRDAVGDAGMRPIERASIDRLAAVDPKTGQIDWGSMMKRLDDMGTDTLDAMFPRGQAQDLQKLTRLMLNVERKPVTKAGRLAIAVSQWGAFAGVMSGTMTGPSAVVLITPPVLARIMSNPTGLKWLTTGLQAPLGSAEAIRAGAQLTAFLRREAEQPQPVPSHTPAPQ